MLEHGEVGFSSGVSNVLRLNLFTTRGIDERVSQIPFSATQRDRRTLSAITTGSALPSSDPI